MKIKKIALQTYDQDLSESEEIAKASTSRTRMELPASGSSHLLVLGPRRSSFSSLGSLSGNGSTPGSSRSGTSSCIWNCIKASGNTLSTTVMSEISSTR